MSTLTAPAVLKEFIEYQQFRLTTMKKNLSDLDDEFDQFILDYENKSWWGKFKYRFWLELPKSVRDMGDFHYIVHAIKRIEEKLFYLMYQQLAGAYVIQVEIDDSFWKWARSQGHPSTHILTGLPLPTKTEQTTA